MSSVSAEILIELNGEQKRIPAGSTLPELLGSLGLPLPAMLVEHNGRALLRSEWLATKLTDGDRLELLRVVAGG